jgi:hypothetical protein
VEGNGALAPVFGRKKGPIWLIGPGCVARVPEGEVLSRNGVAHSGVEWSPAEASVVVVLPAVPAVVQPVHEPLA